LPGCVGYRGRHGGDVNIEQAVFLVGGLGSRLHGLTSERAKPMLDVGGRPFLDYLLDEASRYGIKRALLLCGYRAGDLTPVYQGRAIRGMRIDTVVEASPAGTAGALALAADRLDDDFLLVNGDSLFDFIPFVRHGDFARQRHGAILHVRAEVIEDREEGVPIHRVRDVIEYLQVFAFDLCHGALRKQRQSSHQERHSCFHTNLHKIRDPCGVDLDPDGIAISTWSRRK